MLFNLNLNVWIPVFNEGIVGLFAYCSGYKIVCSKLRRYVLRLKKEFENYRFVSMFKRHALNIKAHGFCWQSLCLLR